MHIYSVFFWKFAYETFPKLESSLVFEYKGNICALLEHESLFILNFSPFVCYARRQTEPGYIHFHLHCGALG